jgi:hypothetical protein
LVICLNLNLRFPSAPNNVSRTSVTLKSSVM